MQYLFCKKNEFYNCDFNGFSTPDRVEIYLSRSNDLFRDGVAILLNDDNFEQIGISLEEFIDIYDCEIV